MYAHDLCCGLGGFASALGFVGTQVISAVDFSSLALSAFQLNHDVPSFCADVGNSELLFQLHRLQNQHKCQPLITAGFPCQPLSAQGQQLREQDWRGGTLKSLPRCAFWLQSAGLLLECVPEALHDFSTQRAMWAFAQLMNFDIL